MKAKRSIIIIALFIAIAALALAGYFFFQENPLRGGSSVEEGREVVYRCDNGNEIRASFSDTGVAFSLSDGRSFNLLTVPSASGAKYTNRDGSIIFWTKEYSAFLEENDESVYTGCVVSPLSLP